MFRASWGRLSPFGATIHIPRCHHSLPLSLAVLMLTWFALVVIASSTKLAPGVVAKVCLSFSSSVFVTYVLSNSSSGLEFVGDNSAALQQLNLSLRHWCRHLLGWPSASPQQFTGSWVSAMHSALPSDVHSRCLVAFVPWTTLPLAIQCKAHGRTGARPLFGAPLLRPSDIGSREAIPRLDRDLRLRLATMASDLHGVRVGVSSDTFLPAKENPVYSFNLPPSAVRLWGLARWGHDLSSTSRPSHHLLAPSTCPFCHDVDGSLAHHLSSCPAHINARATWAHSCGVSPPDVPTLARHGWMFNPLDELNTPQTIRAHIRFVGLVCESLRPPSW